MKKLIAAFLIFNGLQCCDVTPELMQEQLSMLPRSVANIVVDYAQALKTNGKFIFNNEEGRQGDYGDDVLQLIDRNKIDSGIKLVGSIIINVPRWDILNYQQLDEDVKKWKELKKEKIDLVSKLNPHLYQLNAQTLLIPVKLIFGNTNPYKVIGSMGVKTLPQHLPLELLTKCRNSKIEFITDKWSEASSETRVSLTLPESEQKKLDEIIELLRQKEIQKFLQEEEINEDDPRFIWREDTY